MVEGARLEIVWARKRLGGSNPLASATPLAGCLKKRNSYLALLDANPLASATPLAGCLKKRNSYLALLDANPLASATIKRGF